MTLIFSKTQQRMVNLPPPKPKPTVLSTVKTGCDNCKGAK